jgi:putative ATP-binding cassette transporter
LQHYTDGFQEIRLNADKNDALHKRFKRVLNDLERVVVGIGGKWAVLLLFSNAFLYALVGVVVFVLPIFFQGYTDTIYKIVAASIFLVGPVAAVTSAAPLFAKANIGLGHVFELEQRLNRDDVPVTVPGDETNPFLSFKTITLEGIQFSYRDVGHNAIFTTGPWTLDIHRGERLFVLGGNGSGKSTALKLIANLYESDGGQILVDGVSITDVSRPNYRALFSCIFTDFHLFDRLYGLEGVSPSRVNDLIRWMELEDKVEFTNGQFSTLELSTGQRKRLAMIVSLLEDREIYLFDEWAADQDAHFREIFYTEILAQLKEQGKTVLVVTHDDRYWHLSDRTLNLEIGAMGPVSPPHPRSDKG